MINHNDKTRCLVKSAALFVGMAGAGMSYADLSAEPFEGSALTDYQKAAWNHYIDEYSGRFGCSYGDDPRLASDPEGLLTTAASGSLEEPVSMTYRSYKRLPTDVKDILGTNVAIQSMDCRNYYVYDGEVQGVPMVPFEEAISMAINAYEDGSSDSALATINSQVTVAPMDIRYYFPLFLVKEDGLDLLGFNSDALLDMGAEHMGFETIYADELAPALASMLNGPTFFVDPYEEGYDGKCFKTPTNPAREMFVDQTLSGSDLKDFLSEVGILYKTGRGFELALQEPVTEEEIKADENSRYPNPPNPFFDTDRNFSFQSQECRS
jgi:hypothetical protein